MAEELTEEQKREKLAAVQENLLFNHRVPAFEKRCAELGIHFSTPEELQAGIETVAMIRTKEAELRQQGVDTTPSPVKVARDLLKQSMVQQPQQAAPVGNAELAANLNALLG